MMICPEVFYESELKGKSVEQIEKVIRRLKKEMTNLKKTIEWPDPEHIRIEMHPSLEVQLKCTREYLERAKNA